ncbi:MAG: nucleoside-diphosphate kinase [Deltaproteobacteria bacterium]|nr:nucleoside-diphosphate kinase [Deltaproteobacteria bacterium]
MESERTLAMIKPDAVARGLVPRILSRIQESGLKILALKSLKLTASDAGGFYEVHKGKHFYEPLCSFMSSGPIIALVLEGEDAIARWRKLMGATDPAEADNGTIRKELAESKERNVVHGSDSKETAAFEISFFFSGIELTGIK